MTEETTAQFFRRVACRSLEDAAVQFEQGNAEGGMRLVSSYLSAIEDLSDDQDLVFVYFVLGGLRGFIERQCDEYEGGKKFAKEVASNLRLISEAVASANKEDLNKALRDFIVLLHERRVGSLKLKKVKTKVLE